MILVISLTWFLHSDNNLRHEGILKKIAPAALVWHLFECTMCLTQTKTSKMASGAFLRLGYHHKISICIYIYGHPSTKKFMVPLVVRYGPISYPDIYTYPLIYQPVDLSRSISTVGGDSLEHIEFPAKLLDYLLQNHRGKKWVRVLHLGDLEGWDIVGVE